MNSPCDLEHVAKTVWPSQSSASRQVLLQKLQLSLVQCLQAHCKFFLVRPTQSEPFVNMLRHASINRCITLEKGYLITSVFFAMFSKYWVMQEAPSNGNKTMLVPSDVP